MIFDDFTELHGDRTFRDDQSIVGGLALLAGRPVMVIGHQKGRGTRENIARNFGMPHPEGYRKALRLMQYAGRLGLPLLTFIDTPGAYPGIAAEERNQSEAIARNLLVMSRLPDPDRLHGDRRGRQRRRAGDRRRRPRADAGERDLLGDQPGRAARRSSSKTPRARPRRRGVAADRARTAAPRHRRRGGAGTGRRRAHRPGRHG